MNLKKLMAALLAATTSLSLLAGCGSSDFGTSEESAASDQSTVSSKTETEGNAEAAVPGEITYPVDSDVTLRVYVQGYMSLSSLYTDYDDVPFCQGLEERTGIDIEWESVPAGADGGAAYNLMLQEEELPDIIIGNKCAPSNIAELLEDGVAQDISEYLPLYAPDYWEFINSEEQAKNLRLIKQGDRVVNFIGVRESEKYTTYAGTLIRKDWLDDLGLEIPVTIEEYEEVAVAFHEKYGAVVSVPSDRMKQGFVAGAVGAQATTTLRFYQEDGQVKCANDKQEWKDFLTLMNKWYEMGILDPNFATADNAAVRALALEGKMGISYSILSQWGQWRVDAEEEGTGAEWIGIANPVAQEGDMLTFTQTEYTSWTGDAGAIVTTDCTEEELIAALQLLNYGYTEEGKIYWNFGEEDVAHEYNEAGKIQFTELITKDERGMNQALYDYTGAHSMPVGVQLEALVEARNPQNTAAVEAWVSNSVAADYYVPVLVYTAEEQTTKSDIDGALSTYVSEMALKFITGEEPLDDFDSFVETLYDMGLQESLDIANAAYQRLLAK